MKKLGRKGTLSIAAIMIISVCAVALYAVAASASQKQRVRNAFQNAVDASVIVMAGSSTGGTAVDGNYLCGYSSDDLKACFKDECLRQFFLTNGSLDFIYCVESDGSYIRNFSITLSYEEGADSFTLIGKVYVPVGFCSDYSSYFSNTADLKAFGLLDGSGKPCYATGEDDIMGSLSPDGSFSNCREISVSCKGSCHAEE